MCQSNYHSPHKDVHSSPGFSQPRGLIAGWEFCSQAHCKFPSFTSSKRSLWELSLCTSLLTFVMNSESKQSVFDLKKKAKNVARS